MISCAHSYTLKLMSINCQFISHESFGHFVKFGVQGAFSLYKLLLIGMRTASLTIRKAGGCYKNKVTSSLTFRQRPGN